MNKVNMLLKEARRLIDAPENWTKEALARNEEGYFCPSTNENAIAFCVVGSIERAAYGKPDRYNDDEVRDALLLLTYEIPTDELDGQKHLARWQDRSETTHADVMSLFDRAIIDETEKGV